MIEVKLPPPKSKMRLFLLAILLALNSSCATVQPIAPTVPVSKQVELQPLPPDPSAEPLPKETPLGDWVVPIEKGETVQNSGIEISEERAVRDALYRMRYKELRSNYSVDMRVWVAQRELYESRLNDAEKALVRAQPNWFQRHAWEIGLFAGVVVGSGAAIGIVYATAPGLRP